MSFELEDFTPPEGQRWQAGEDVIKQLWHDGYVEFKDGTPFRRYFEDEEGAEHDPFYCFMEVDWSSTSEAGKNELNELLGNNHGFDTVKPTRLLTTLVQSCIQSHTDDIVLDFFAGSGTTGNAVLNLNAQDDGNRRFILVQLPEPTERQDYPTIANLTIERVRRVVTQITTTYKERLPLDNFTNAPPGFRVFKLAESNFTTWDAQVSHEPKALQNQLDFHVDHIREARTADDILYELLLKSGFPLTTPVEKLTLAGKTVHSVASGALMICLERELTLELIRAIADAKPERVVCLDEGFAGNDQLKANAVQTFKTKGIVKFQTV
jgi:adenine-specific DNA-methyltransferase